MSYTPSSQEQESSRAWSLIKATPNITELHLPGSSSPNSSDNIHIFSGIPLTSGVNEETSEVILPPHAYIKIGREAVLSLTGSSDSKNPISISLLNLNGLQEMAKIDRRDPDQPVKIGRYLLSAYNGALNAYASETHLSLGLLNGRLVAQDLGSTNGTDIIVSSLPSLR